MRYLIHNSHIHEQDKTQTLKQNISKTAQPKNKSNIYSYRAK